MTASDLKTPETIERTALNAESFTSYSLNFEDVILHRLFPVTQTGFYVDVGAGHPRFENDTFSLYQRGWRGINIEPNPDFHSALMEERPRDINLQVLLSDNLTGTLTYYELSGSGLSTCDVEQAAAYQAAGRDIVLREVPVSTLSSILTEVGVDRINILKVDVEGFEEKVLNGNDWDKFRPDIVVVEATYPESPVRRPTQVVSFMEQRGYRHVHFDGLNDFYLEREFSAPEGLTLPPNVFDRFVPREIADLRSQLESLQTKSAAAVEYALLLQTKSAALEEYALSLQTKSAAAEEYALSQQTKSAALEEYALSLQTKSAALEEYALSLQTQVDETLLAVDALAVENRRIGHKNVNLTFENQRLRAGAEQMRAELLVLNQLIETVHEVANAHLASVYSSRCWRLTAPLRWCDHIQRRIVTRLQMRLRDAPGRSGVFMKR